MVYVKVLNIMHILDIFMYASGIAIALDVPSNFKSFQVVPDVLKVAPSNYLAVCNMYFNIVKYNIYFHFLDNNKKNQ
jgi:hypothetical protein